MKKMTLGRHLTAAAAIARVTIIQAARSKVFILVLAFGLAVLLLGTILSNLTLGWPVRIVTNLAWTGTTVACTLLAILLGATTLASDVDRRTIQPILAKPIARTPYLLGKYVGVTATCAATAVAMSVVSAIAIAIYSHNGAFQYPVLSFVALVALLLTRLAIISAIAVFFSTVAGPAVSIISTSGLALAGYSSRSIRHFLGQSDSEALRLIGDAIYFAVPDFTALEALHRLVHEGTIMDEAAIAALSYGALYCAAALIAASFFFARRSLG